MQEEPLAYVEIKYGQKGIWAQPFIHPDAEDVPARLAGLLKILPALGGVYLCSILPGLAGTGAGRFGSRVQSPPGGDGQRTWRSSRRLPDRLRSRLEVGMRKSPPLRETGETSHDTETNYR
jgi:hypothetical protein